MLLLDLFELGGGVSVDGGAARPGQHSKSGGQPRLPLAS